MSRIKGHYKQGGHTTIKEARWLEPSTGRLFESKAGIPWCNHGFTQNSDGTWGDGRYMWVPDATPELTADWYVLAVCPSVTHIRNPMNVQGPYTEQGARSKATDRAAQYPKNTYAVFRVQAGDTVKVVPPTPPQPEVIWS